MNGFKFRRCYDTKLNLYRYNNQAVFNLTNDLLDFLIISKSKIMNFKLHRYASFIPTWITKESALLFKEVLTRTTCGILFFIHGTTHSDL